MRNPALLAIAILSACGPSTDVPEDVNLAPVADAGKDQALPADGQVSLDGRGSYDPDGDKIWYTWTLDSAPPGSALLAKVNPFSANNSADAGSTAFHPDKVGTYVIGLVVTDGKLISAQSFVIIDAADPQARPEANAGSDLNVEAGDTAALSGVGSTDPLNGRNGPLAYSWSLVDVPYNSGLETSDVSGATALEASFRPDVPGEFTVTLIVDNGMVTSLPDAVTVWATGDNEVPSAVIDVSPTGEDCTSLPLSCTDSSDPEGATLSYFWELQAKPSTSAANNKSFDDRTAGEPTFWPDVAGKYTFSCSVFDGIVWSTPMLATVNLAERAKNTAPLVKAGADRTEKAGDAECVEDGYTFDCASCPGITVDVGTDGSIVDADSDPLVIAWSVTTTGKASIAKATVFPTQSVIGNTTPEEPDACAKTEFTYAVQAVDCPGAIGKDDVMITVECCGIEAPAAP